MPAIQLKDLMNPLVNIEQYSQTTNQKLVEISSFLVTESKNGLKTQRQMMKFAVENAAIQNEHLANGLKTQQMMMKFAVENAAIQNGHLAKIAENTKKSLLGQVFRLIGIRLEVVWRKKVIERLDSILLAIGSKSKEGSSIKDRAPKATKAIALSMLGSGIYQLAIGLTNMDKLSKSALKAFELVIAGINKIMDKLTEKQVKKMKDGGEALFLLGEGISKFAKSLAASLIFLIPGLFAIPLLVTSLLSVGGIVILLGSKGKEFEAGAQALRILGKGLMWFSVGMLAAALLLLIPNPEVFLVKLLGLITLAGLTVAGIGKLGKSLANGANAMKKIGEAVGSFLEGFASLESIIGTIVLSLFIKTAFAMVGLITVTGMAMALIGTQAARVNEGIKAISGMGKALMTFSSGLFIYMLASIPILINPLFGVILVATLYGFAKAFEVLGRTNAKKGAMSLTLMGISLAIFSAGYAYFNRTIGKLEFEDITKQLFLLGGVLGIAFLASKIGVKNAALGALAIALLGPALWAFGWGYEKFAEASKGLSFGAVGVQLLILGGVLVIATLAGLAMSSGVPALGALAIALLGPALWAFSWGYSEFAKATEDANMESVKTQLLLLGGMVAVTSLAGLALPLVLLGAVSLGLIGLGVFGLSFGLKKYKEIGWTIDDSANLTGTISSLLTAFGAVPPGGAGGGGGDAGFFGFLGDMGQTVGNIIKGGLGAIAVIANALSLIVIGASVATLAMGLKPYKELGWQDSDTDTLTHLMKSLMGVFGGSGEGGGVLSALGGLVKSGINAATATVNTGIFFVASKVIPALAKGLIMYNKAGWSMDKTKILIGSMMAISKSVSKFDDISKNSTSRFMSTMTTLSNNADGLMNAADGVKAIADAINSVDVTKADSMSKFFGAATEYSKSSESGAMESLIETVAEIRDSINSLGQSSIQVEGTAIAAGGGSDNKSLGESLASLQATLNQINATMSNLPADIAAIEIRLPQD